MLHNIMWLVTAIWTVQRKLPINERGRKGKEQDWRVKFRSLVCR